MKALEVVVFLTFLVITAVLFFRLWKKKFDITKMLFLGILVLIIGTPLILFFSDYALSVVCFLGSPYLLLAKKRRTLRKEDRKWFIIILVALMTGVFVWTISCGQSMLEGCELWWIPAELKLVYVLGVIYVGFRTPYELLLLVHDKNHKGPLGI